MNKPSTRPDSGAHAHPPVTHIVTVIEDPNGHVTRWHIADSDHEGALAALVSTHEDPNLRWYGRGLPADFPRTPWGGVDRGERIEVSRPLYGSLAWEDEHDADPVAYDYDAQEWRTGEEARILLVAALDETIAILESPAGNDFATFHGSRSAADLLTEARRARVQYS